MSKFTLESDGRSIRGLYTFETIQDIAHFDCQVDPTEDQAKEVLQHIVDNYESEDNIPRVIHQIINDLKESW